MSTATETLLPGQTHRGALPAACYTRDAWLDRERAAIFGRGWFCVGRAGRWLGSGAYVASEVIGSPLVVLRDNAKRLRAFANSCRHRGAKLLTDAGICQVVRCPFHRWTYALDGRLLLAPTMDRTPGFDPADHHLVEFACEERGGWVFVSTEAAELVLDDWLGDFEAVHAPWALDTLVETRRTTFVVDCNWKAYADVFNEYYHLPCVHPDSFNDRYDPPDPGDDVTGRYASQFSTTEGPASVIGDAPGALLPDIPGLDGRNRSGTRYTWVFPNLTFAASNDCVWAHRVMPIAPDRTQVEMSVLFPPATAALADFESRAQPIYERLDTGIAEDLPFLENQQAGLSSPFARTGPFSWLESNVEAFARWYAGQMAEHAAPLD